MSQINTNKSIDNSNVAVKKRYNYIHKTGRPTKYDPKFVDEVDKYLATTGLEFKTLPTMQGFALWIGVDDETLIEWANKYKDFSATLKRLKSLQAQQLVNDGMYSRANPLITKLLLMNNHGMRERTDTTSAGEKLEGIKITIVEDKPKIVEGEVIDG